LFRTVAFRLQAEEPRHNMPDMLLFPDTQKLTVARDHRLLW